ncbi:anther-specific proline-rich protein APG [Iris pallida]|uniref:Anther-specific proline-rich protein APG n=1 Tax=Iris pallida TaxID=29817 RepID=A0AAX6G563_IRIPA|nr:anther-specific proline-rich protein APG [Iris pallida]
MYRATVRHFSVPWSSRGQASTTRRPELPPPPRCLHPFRGRFPVVRRRRSKAASPAGRCCSRSRPQSSRGSAQSPENPPTLLGAPLYLRSLVERCASLPGE